MARFDPDPGEQVQGSWTCGIPDSPKSGVVKHEGTLVLTDHRLVYEPLSLLGGASAARLGGQRREFSLREIRSAEAVPGRLARLQLTFADGESFLVIVSGSRFSVPWSKRKWIALEEAVEAINSASSAAS